MSKQTDIKIFEDKKVRTLWDAEHEKWYLSIVDVIAVLTDSPNPQVYWRVLKKRLKDEGNETVTNCNALKMPAPDGKMRLTDVAENKDILTKRTYLIHEKIKIIFFLILISSNHMIAQDYQTLNSGRIAYFENQSGEISCIHIDSVKFETDSILHPVSNIQQTDYGCYTPYGASWLSSKVILQPNGCNMFFNLNLDTIKIKTNASLNESWVSYEIPDSLKIISTIVSADTCTILGLSDSVKIIDFKYYDKNMSLVNHGLNTMTIKISKFHGLIRTLNFTYFPDHNSNGLYDGHLEEFNLIGLSNPKVGIQNLTWFEANDFQIGDEIHILDEEVRWGPWCSGNYSNKTIKKYIDRKDFKDSIIYAIERIASKYNLSYGISESEYFHDTIIEKIIPSPEFDYLPGEPFMIGSTAYINTMYNGFLVSKAISSEEYYFSGSNDCWYDLSQNADACIGIGDILKGLGGPYYYCSMGIDCYTETNYRPVYFKKGSTTWGVPLIITAVPENCPLDNIEIYPNPAKDFIIVSVQNPEFPYLLELSDIEGKLVSVNELNAYSSAVNIENLCPGIYIYRLSKNGEIIKSGKLIIE